MKCLIFFASVALLWAGTSFAELAVDKNVDGGNAERVTFSGDYAVSPSLSPDGKTLTYITRSGRRYRVAVMNLATGEEMILTSTDLDESPCFSPNGQMIVYASERNKRGVSQTMDSIVG